MIVRVVMGMIMGVTIMRVAMGMVVIL